MKTQEIRTKPDFSDATVIFGGHLSGKRSSLWIGHKIHQTYAASISGGKLYRLAKAIVRHYEGDKSK